VLSQTVGLLDGLGENENDSAEIPIGDPPAAAIVTLLGIDVLGDPTVIAALADQLRAAGVMEVSDAGAEIARVEAGIPRIGFELDENTIPQEAGINGRAVNFEKGCYVGQETVARLHYKGKPNRMLRGLRPETAVAPGAVITAPDGKELGHVGSAVVSPQYGPLALAIIRREVEAGDSVDVDGVSALVTEPGVHP
jgi:folate-binding protein YgfZ